MAMDATAQIRMNGELKEQVENLYRSMGTSFAEAVRIFAQQSLRDGGMPFRPTLRSWDDLTTQEIDAKLRKSEEEISSGAYCSQAALDARIQEKFSHG